MDASIFFRYPGEPADTAAASNSVRFLSELREDELRDVLGYTQARRYSRGEAAMRRGDTDRSLYVVTAGSFEVVERTRRTLLRPGDIFGELAFFDHQPQSADVRAVQDSEAVVMTPTGFDRLRLAQPQLALRFALLLGRVVSMRFRGHDRSLAALSKP